MQRILITGATGRVGGALAATLAGRGLAVRALVRDRHELPPSIEVVHGDLTEAGSLDGALEGVDSVFLYAAGDRAAELSRALARSSVQQVVVLSTIDATNDRAYAQHNRRRHLAFEHAAADAVPRTTFLRPGAFASNALRFWRSDIAHGVVRLPFPESQQAPIDERDIAEVAAHALTTCSLDGRAVVLTGPQSLAQRDQVACLADALARPLRIEPCTVDVAREHLSRIIPPAYVELLLAQWADEVGHPAAVTDEVEAITGHPATAYGAWARRNRGLFA